ncbi:hemolysin family protein [Opitutus sp. ER46]|uniref:hemolysin family protein n=1 Tax=Opitutus sp. ER46 TaxID=2161864 RepID=UPI000D31AFE5|nr:hemolysin family protein [Opitutus sp. ER46]PTX91779.1 HlyC/CorC family transporter [Opitutus sp. ER46]
MHEVFVIILELLAIFALVAANGFFVAAEFALVKVRTSQLQPLAKQGGWRVKVAIQATRHLDAALSATQLGITLASLGLGWLGEPFLAHRLAPLLRYVGITDPGAVSSISISVAFMTITFFHIVLGELAPKSLAIQRPKGVALNTAGPLMIFYRLLYPFIWALNGTANTFLRWGGLQPATEGEHEFSADELEHVFSHARHSHPGDALINRLMVRSLRLRTTTAQQVMRPRDQIVALWLDKPLAENLRIAQTAGFSRLPVCQGSLDDVKGVVLVREWLWQTLALGPEASYEPLIRPYLTFTLRTPIHAMIEHFRTSRSHLAIVLDDGQNTAGLISFEDVLEEIVGDIRDELDLGEGPVFEQTDLLIVVSGRFTMRELQAETGWDLEWERRETVGEWAERRRGRPLKRGESFVTGDYRVTAVDVSAERVRRVKIERAPVERTV